MKKKIQMIFLYLCLCFMLFPCTVLAADGGKQGEVVRVAFPETTSLNVVNPDGTLGGITYEFLLEISKYTGWEYEYVLGNPSELIDGMIEGEYDLMGGMFYIPGYEEMFNYPDYTMGHNNSLLIYKDSHPVIRTFDLTTLDGMTIGVYKRATSKIKRLNTFLEFNNLNCEIKEYEELEDYENCLENGEVDVLLGNDMNLKDGLSVAAQFEAEPYYLVTSKEKTDLCEQLNAAITEIYAANPNFAKELQDKYHVTEYISPIVLSDKDKQFIENAPPVRVGIIRSRYPIYYSKENKAHGIIVDLCSLLTEKTGLEFTFVLYDSYQEIIDGVKAGEADVIGCYMDDFSQAEKQDLFLVKSYSGLDSVILKNKLADYPSDHLTMAVLEGCHETNTGANGKAEYYRNYKDCLSAIDKGEADYMRIPSAYLEELYAQNTYPNIVIIATDNVQTDLSMALPAPINIDLYSVLSKGINNMSEEEKHDLVANNLVSSGNISVSLKTLIYSNPAAFIGVAIAFFILIMVVVLLLANTKIKNKVMALKVEKIEETARAKSEFLSRMSHEIRTPMNAIIGLTNLTQITCTLPEDAKQNLEKINDSAQFLLALVNDVLDMSKIDSSKMIIEKTPFNLDELLKQVENIFTLQAQKSGLEFTVTREYDTPYFIGDEIRIKQVLTNLLSNACKFTKEGGKVEFSVKQTGRGAEGIQLLFCVKDTGVGISEEDIDRVFESFEQSSNRIKNVKGTGLGLPISKNLVSLMGGKLEVTSAIGKGTEFFFTIEMPVSENAPEYKEKDEIPEISLEGKHILLAEDNDLNAEITIAILELKGTVVERAANGQEAVERYLSHEEGWFDIILMDIQMPVKNGLEAAMAIRKETRLDAKSIPIIAMTANTFQEDRESAREAGMTGFVPKPFNVKQLYQALYEAEENKK